MKVNQVGYHLNADKYALISGFAHKFTTPVGTIFRVKETDDYYVNVNSNFLDNEIEVSDSRNSDFFCIETPAPGTEMCAYTFYTHVPRIQNGYEIKINEEVFRVSLTK